MNILELTVTVMLIALIILIGAVISMGNERQRKAIDRGFAMVNAYLVAEFRLQRHQTAKDIQIEDPVAWFNALIKRTLHITAGATQCRTADEPSSVWVVANDHSILALSPLSPDDAKAITRNASDTARGNAAISGANPLFPYPKNAKVTTLSVLTSGDIFDLEADYVWAKVAGGKSNLPHSDIWYLYEIPAKR